MIRKKTTEEIEKLRKGGAILAKIMRELGKEIKPGVVTDYLDQRTRELMRENGGKSAILGYKPTFGGRPFPASICVSVNEQIVHGIPNENPIELREGDIVTLDTEFEYEGLITDHAWTFPVGKISDDVKKFLKQNEEALYTAIKKARVGNKVGDISAAIQSCAEKYDLGIVKELSGHGVGYTPHEDPLVLNYGKAGTGAILEEGLVLAIEPIFSMGNGKMYVERDGYTCVTSDGTYSAQFEHTIVVTAKGPIILTK